MNLATVAINHARTVLALFFLIIVAGAASYVSIPRESSPDVPIPIIYVSMSHEGISPEDAVDLLIKPMEKELRGIEGVDEMEATAYEGGANIVMHFQAGFDNDTALDDVREKVDIAKAELPSGDEAEEPRVKEVNISLFPVISVVLSGNVDERTLKRIAEDLQDELETIPEVLEAPVKGMREEMVLFEIDRLRLESYGLTNSQVINAISAGNRLVAAGSMELDSGKYAIKVPGLIDNLQDMMNLPLANNGDKLVRIKDVADVKLTFKDATTITRVNGESAMALDVSKRIGENVIITVDEVKRLVEEVSAQWPQGVEYSFVGDASAEIKRMVNSLQNNVIMAVLLVMMVVLAALGLRPSLLVASTVPGSFLAAILCLHAIGVTLNMVVLFSLILAVGMLVDGAIVVAELAERQRTKGMGRRDAFAYASSYMAWPIIASTATTLAVFMPLLWWPGIPGEFMKYMPLTMIFTLSASLVMALIVLPTLGSLLPGGHVEGLEVEDGEGKWSKIYGDALEWSLQRPWKILGAVVAAFIASIILYGVMGKGVEFFPDVEPERANILAHVKGDFSLAQKDAVMAQLTHVVDGIEGIATSKITTGEGVGQGGTKDSGDVIGNLFLEFKPWKEREGGHHTADKIIGKILDRTKNIPGVFFEARKERGGPNQGKPIKLVVTAGDYALLAPVVAEVRKELSKIDGVLNIDDDLPKPGIEMAMEIDRGKAQQSGTTLAEVGGTLRLATTGMIVGNYRPSDRNEEIDIVARFKDDQRDMTTLDNMRVATARGLVPVSDFTKRVPQQKVTVIHRLDRKNSAYVEADVAPGVLADDIVKAISAELKNREFPSGVRVEAKGDAEDQAEAAGFLQKAFMVALFLMAIILVTQFNSFYQAFIILSAVVFSTTGVLLGHLIIDKPFGVVMSGVGVIALAGVVVNNNIVLIDTFNKLVKEMHWYEALVQTGKSRLRPVMLTAITTIIGLLPMGLMVDFDLMNRYIGFGAPSSQWWFQLSNSIIFGLALATVLTLIVTPCMLALGQRRGKK